MTGLVDLDVSCNRLTTLMPSIAPLAGLVHLSVALNPLRELPEDIGALTNLVSLAASCCSFEGLWRARLSCCLTCRCHSLRSLRCAFPNTKAYTTRPLAFSSSLIPTHCLMDRRRLSGGSTAPPRAPRRGAACLPRHLRGSLPAHRGARHRLGPGADLAGLVLLKRGAHAQDGRRSRARLANVVGVGRLTAGAGVYVGFKM